LSVARAEKERRLTEVLGWLVRDFQCMRLDEAAQALAV